MPNVENIKKWVDALESNQYEQGTGALKEGDKFCCLGVASDVYLKETQQEGWTQGITDKDVFSLDETQCDVDDLPLQVRGWLGLVESNPTLSIPSHLSISCGDLNCQCTKDNRYSAIYLNDGKGFRFNQIAECIRYTYLTEGDN